MLKASFLAARSRHDFPVRLRELLERFGIKPHDVMITPEQLGHDELGGACGEISARVFTLSDIAIFERNLVIGEKLSHSAAFLSGRCSCVRVESEKHHIGVHQTISFFTVLDRTVITRVPRTTGDFASISTTSYVSTDHDQFRSIRSSGG